MKFVKIFILYLLFFSIVNSNAQDGFRFLNKNKKVERVKFELINNLIVLPISVNNKKLSFILDTGVSKTILFNPIAKDSIYLKSVEKINLQGLGGGNPIEALISKGNKFKLKNIVSFNETIYVVVRDFFDLSGKMGTTIHGIIGYNLISKFVLKINYKKKYIDFFDPDNFKQKKCRKCETLPLELFRRKPYVNLKVQLDTIGEKLTDVKLLIDSGGSDALWLFEHTKPNIVTPKKHFNDILGEGLSGTIFGNRSRISKIRIGSFEIKEPTVSFLDTVSTKNARVFEKRNGSLGANILKRFTVWLNYSNNEIILKKTGSLTKGFNYNMSGLDIVYNGKQVVKQIETTRFTDSYNRDADSNNSFSFETTYSFKFKPSFIVRNVVRNSPADRAGILKGDIILNINNKPAYEYKLDEITRKFQEKDGKKITIKIDRNGVKKRFQFRLEKKI